MSAQTPEPESYYTTVLSHAAADKSCPKAVAIGQLCCGAFLFVMRSCAYLDL